MVVSHGLQLRENGPEVHVEVLVDFARSSKVKNGPFDGWPYGKVSKVTV